MEKIIVNKITVDTRKSRVKATVKYGKKKERYYDLPVGIYTILKDVQEFQEKVKTIEEEAEKKKETGE